MEGSPGGSTKLQHLKNFDTGENRSAPDQVSQTGSLYMDACSLYLDGQSLHGHRQSLLGLCPFFGLEINLKSLFKVLKFAFFIGRLS